MNKSDIEAKFLGASVDQNISKIDLHKSENILDALYQLEKDLFLFSKNNCDYCRVIHGIGTGRLAEAVHESLDNNPIVLKWREEQGGSCVVLF